MAGIAVPLFIHLWNVKKGKTLKVGSIAFLSETARTHSKSLRVSDWPLLLLRCLLLLLLSLLIAGTFLETQDNSIKEKGWVLLDKNDLQAGYKAFALAIDSLTKAGFVLHYFNKGFAQGSLSDSADKDTARHTSYWTLLKELDQQVPAGLPVYLFTNNQRNYIKGERPSVALDLHWKTYTTGDTSFINAPQPDTTTLTVCIYADKPAMGANYIKAALEAVRDAGKQKLRISTAANIQGVPKNLDWLFWLSETRIPVDITRTLVFAYTGGKPIDIFSPVVVADNINVSAEEGLENFKTIRQEKADNIVPLWKNGYGETILGKEGNVFHFYSRLDPQWSSLPWSARFPQLIASLLSSEKNNNSNNASAIPVDEQQLLPAVKTAGSTSLKSLLLKKTDLTKGLWILAFIILLVERILTHNRRKEVANG